jgi:hypothetical protein
MSETSTVHAAGDCAIRSNAGVIDVDRDAAQVNDNTAAVAVAAAAAVLLLHSLLWRSLAPAVAAP